MKRTALKRKAPIRRAKPKPPMKRCDDMARLINAQRAKFRCEGRPGHVCKGSLQWAHIIGREAHWIRHDEDNALLLCAAEHFYFTQRHVEWVLYIGDERYIDLVHRASAGLHAKIDWKAREAGLRARIEELA